VPATPRQPSRRAPDRLADFIPMRDKRRSPFAQVRPTRAYRRKALQQLPFSFKGGGKIAFPRLSHNATNPSYLRAKRPAPVLPATAFGDEATRRPRRRDPTLRWLRRCRPVKPAFHSSGSSQRRRPPSQPGKKPLRGDEVHARLQFGPTVAPWAPGECASRQDVERVIDVHGATERV